MFTKSTILQVFLILTKVDSGCAVLLLAVCIANSIPETYNSNYVTYHQCETQHKLKIFGDIVKSTYIVCNFKI